MKNSTLVFLITMIIFSFSCQPTRDCKCPMEDLASKKKIVTEEQNGQNTDWGLEGTIAASIRKIVDAETTAKVGQNKYNISTAKVVSKISNEFPQFIDRTYELKIGRLFFCAYYEILCNDRTISDSFIREQSDKKLTEFKAEFYDHSHITNNDHHTTSSQFSSPSVLLENTRNDHKEKSKFSVTIKDADSQEAIKNATLIHNGRKMKISEASSSVYFFELDLSQYEGQKIAVQVTADQYNQDVIYLNKEGQRKTISLHKTTPKE